jgi:hypothetical protein
MKCTACRDGVKAPFEFTMAFQPIVSLSQQKVWAY